MLKYDIEVKITNSRRSRSPIYDKYRPVFPIHNSYLTSGEITGYAIVTKILNESLASDVVGEEGKLQL